MDTVYFKTIKNNNIYYNIFLEKEKKLHIDGVEFLFNYNVKKLDTTNNVILNEEEGIIPVNLDMTNVNYTLNEDYITVDNKSYANIPGYLNLFNKTGEDPMTILAKVKSISPYNSVFVNRLSSYNYMFRVTYEKVLLHGNAKYGELFFTTPNEAHIVSARTIKNTTFDVVYNVWDEGLNTVYNGFSYGSTNYSGVTFFRGYYNRQTEPWAGDFYWIFYANLTLTDELILQVIDYNENL